MFEIPLSKKSKKHAGKYFAQISPEDKDLLDHNWSVAIPKGCSTMYAVREYYKQRFAIHRVIMERMLGRPLVKGEMPDHIDGNGLNNQRDNLRLATKAQNMMNRGATVKSLSGYKGVTKQGKYWVAQIMVNYQRIYIGMFKTPEEAHAAYCVKAEELHGEFARFE